MKKLAILALASVVGIATSVGPAFANIISIGGGVATVTCTLSCDAFTLGGAPGAPIGMGTLSSSIGGQYSLADSSIATEAAALNTLIGTNLFTSVDGIQTDVPDALQESFSFMTMADYIILKIANTHVFLYNTAMNAITIDYLQVGTKAGISHYTEFGETVVPLPGAIWLMAAGLAGFGFAGRTRKKRA